MRKLTWVCVGLQLAVAGTLGVLPAAVSAWQVELDTEFGESQDDEATGVAFDSRGDVIAAGHADGDDWLIAKFNGGSGAELWRTQSSDKLFGSERADGLVIDNNDDAIVFGRFGGPTYYDDQLTAIKYRGTTGAEIWRYVRDGSAVDSRDSAYAAAVDGNGDVYVVGIIQNETSDRDISVSKVSGADGSEIWARTLTGSEAGGWDYGFAVALDPTGNPVVAGRVQNTGTSADPLVIKLASADGATIWRTEIARTAHEYAQAVVVDSNGDVFFAGDLDDGESGEFGLIKLDGSDGSVLWEQDHCCSNDRGRVEALALTPAGNVVAAGWASRQDFHAAFTVSEFRGTTGSKEWRIFVPGAHGYGTAHTVAVDSRGEVFAAGSIETSGEGNTDAILVRIHPCHFDEDNCEEAAPSYDARVAWKKKYNGKGGVDDDYDEFYDLALDPDGQVVAAGTIWNRNPLYPEESHSDSFLTMRSEDGSKVGGPDPFRPACSDGIDNDGDGLIDVDQDPDCSDGDDLFEVAAVDTPLMCTGRRFQAKDRAGKARKRSFVFQSRDPLLSPPAPSSAGDPRIHGAVIEVSNPLTGEHAYANLVAEGWELKGFDGYRYKGKGGHYGPCKTVQFTPGKLKARCKGLGLRYSLDEPSQGEMAVRLHLANGERICTEFGGEVSHDQSTQDGGTAKFRASNAPPPSVCAAY